VGTHDLRTLWSPPVSLNQERDTQRRKPAFFFNLIFLIYYFWKVPHEIRCWPTSLLQHFSSLNSLSPQGSVLFTVPSSKQPLPSGAKKTTYTTHSWDFRPRHHRPPLPNTHNSLTPGFVTVVGVPGWARSAFLLWRTRPDTPHGGPGRWKSGSARTTRVGNHRTAVPVPPVQRTKKPASLLWWTRPDTPHGEPDSGVRECQAGPVVAGPIRVT